MSIANETHYRRVAEQVERIRKLYSQIGEPLCADIIIDLHLHLGALLDAANFERKDKPRRDQGA